MGRVHHEQRWLDRHQSDLWDSGLPLALTQSVDVWFYFLGHGYYPGDPFRLEDLTVEQLTRLEELVRAFEERFDWRPTSVCTRVHYLRTGTPLKQ